MVTILLRTVWITRKKRIMIEEAYVSFETAKLLKEKGFDVPCLSYYEYFRSNVTMYQGYVPELSDSCTNHNDRGNYDIYSRPTQQMAMRWLREVHNLFLGVGFGADAKGEFLYMADIYNLKNDAIDGIYKPIVEADDYLLNNPKSYEEACEAGIKYCLEYLIKGG